jgi:hypothetical protein
MRLRTLLGALALVMMSLGVTAVASAHSNPCGGYGSDTMCTTTTTTSAPTTTTTVAPTTTTVPATTTTSSSTTTTTTPPTTTTTAAASTQPVPGSPGACTPSGFAGCSGNGLNGGAGVPPKAIAFTGAPVGLQVALGAILVTAGALVLFLVRRVRRAT